jgi:hypothetical protein
VLENGHPNESISPLTLRSEDVTQELEIIAEQLRKEGAITRQDLEALIRQRPAEVNAALAPFRFVPFLTFFRVTGCPAGGGASAATRL